VHKFPIDHPLTQRSAGVLMHLSSLPGRFGVGDCGPEAFAFIDFLKQAGQSWWQMLPLGPMGVGHSPYQTFSAFAASALWISPDGLRKEGWLTAGDLAGYPAFPKRRTDYAGVSREKHRLLGLAFVRFLAGKLPKAFRDFEEEHADWLEDYALFTSLQQLQGRVSWTTWPDMLRRREKHAVDQVRVQLRDKVAFQKFIQFLFFRQWRALRSYAHEHGVGLIGDVPLFISHDSADVWAHRELFELQGKGEPRVVAGVPPDAFSKTGQRWGNPVYNWAAHKAEGYAWWIKRFERLFELFDVLRLDHFIGFHRYWEIPAQEKTALQGQYQQGPGADFFRAVLAALPHASFIAEDLGIVVPEVTALREEFHLPGMSVLQFAFSGDPSKNPYLPSKLKPDTVVYTGTHDNNTTKGWFTLDATPGEIKRVREYIRRPTGPVHWQMIRLAYGSQAGTAIIPMQDLLGLGPEARMNVPGRAEGNWVWRMSPEVALDPIAQELRIQTERCGRLAASSLLRPADLSQTK
jgi:4-alpha-glucanotransferase